MLALWTAASCSGAAAEDYHYRIQPGDNPWTVTQRFLKDISYWPRIQAYNRIDDPTALRPGATLRLPVGWMRATSQHVMIADLRGEVFVESSRGGAARQAVAGMKVPPGATLRTGSEGSASLHFPDGSRTLIGPATVLRLVELRRLSASAGQQAQFELQEGELENDVSSRPGSGGRFIIRTPAATAAVRGTRFRVAGNADGMRNETLQGTVSLRNRRGTTLLPAGSGAYAHAGAAPSAARPLLPAPELGGLPERIERLPARLEIPAVAGAHAYRSRFADAGGGTVASDRSGASAYVLSSAELADGTYLLRVRATDKDGLEGADAERRIVVDARPEPPFTSEPPADGWVLDERPSFRWTKSGDAARYHFQLAQDESFQAPLASLDTLGEPSWTPEQPLAPGAYFWRVAVETEAEGRGPYSDPQRFTLPPPGPQPEAPQVDGGELELRWRAGSPGERFQVQISRDGGFAAPEIDVTTDEARLSLPRPDAGVHHLRVRTLAPGLPPGPWSKAQQFEIPQSHWRALLLLVPALLLAL